ncbi:MAG: septum site-determining protein MinD [Clostridiales bacterium]|nr:septum site-determining protein MinD [Clostridiales bacterium]
MARKILITSGKGGVGKTTVCVNIGTHLSKLGYSVLIVDADFGLNNLDIVMGIENKVVFDIHDVIQGRCRAKQAVIEDYYNRNLYILPASKDVTLTGTNTNVLSNIIAEIENAYDYIIIDCPAGIDKGFVRTLNITREAIVVTTPHISALRDADKVLRILRSVGFDIINIVVNRVRGDLLVCGESIDITFIEEYLHESVVGVVPEDDEINNQLLLGGDIHEGSTSYTAFKKIAKSVSSNKIELYDCTRRYKGFVGAIRRKLRKLS